MNKVLSTSSVAKKLKNSNIRSGTIIYQGSIFGEGLTTGHNATIRENNKLGKNVMVGTNTYLGPNNIIGDNVRIHTGCFIEGANLANNVIISPHVVFTNDNNPPCKECTKEGGVTVKENTVIGANVTILPAITIGANCLIGAGSVVVKDVEDNSVMVGNPARFIRKNKKHVHK